MSRGPAGIVDVRTSQTSCMLAISICVVVSVAHEELVLAILLNKFGLVYIFQRSGP